MKPQHFYIYQQKQWTTKIFTTQQGLDLHLKTDKENYNYRNFFAIITLYTNGICLFALIQWPSAGSLYRSRGHKSEFYSPWLSKQRRHWWNATISCILSMSSLFVKLPVLGFPIYKGLKYCKFGNFRMNFIFTNSLKRHICHVKNSGLGHDSPTSLNDIVI